MKQLMVLTVVLLPLFSFAQTDNDTTKEKVYTIAEQMPEFPGGQQALMKYLASNFQIAGDPVDLDYSSTIYVGFIVTKTGSIANVRILRGSSASFDKEAIRVVHAMPNWAPGIHNGEPVHVSYRMPIRITFK